MKYKLLAIDVDGTLIAPDQVIAPEVIDAITAADAAGLRICLATGRSLMETAPIWRKLRLPYPAEPLVLVGGALVSEGDTGRTLYSRTIRRELACRFAGALAAAGHAAMAIVDGWRYDVDYYLAETGDTRAASRDWFAKMDVRVCRVPCLADADELEGALRISAVLEADAAAKLADELSRQFDGKLSIHAIRAPNYDVTIVEAFAADVSKWSAIQYVAQARKIGRGHIAVIGDDVNDIAMIHAAGLGVAMPNATADVLAAADHVAADGLAAFIGRLADGEFD